MQSTPQPDDKTPITMTLALAQWNLIISGLGKLPLEVAAETWIQIRQEAAQQLQQLQARAQDEAQTKMREDITRG